MKVLERNGRSELTADHTEGGIGQLLIMDGLGIEDEDFFDGILTQLANAGSHGQKIDESGLNFMLAVIKGIEPKDQMEVMLAAQIAAIHMATMTFARRLGHVENIPQQDSAERALNKLARTFAIQVEALKRHRTGGGQTVRVEHVTVNEGGQAIVGNVTQAGGGGVEKSGEQPHALGYAPAPRCRARTRTGQPCRSPAMPNGRCRMHGGKSPGAPKGNKNAFKHGRHTAEAVANRREIAELRRSIGNLARAAE